MAGGEAELFPPLKRYLEQKGYTVFAEVKNCDIAAVKGEDLVVIEIKQSLSLKLILQGAERQELGSPVYIAAAIREGGKLYNKKAVLKLLKRLGLGLILVRMFPEESEIEVLLNPVPGLGKSGGKPPVNRKKRKALLYEIGGRYRDFNIGGSVSSIETMTAYRLKAIKIAVLLDKYGPSSPSGLRELGASFDTGSILYKNYYGWFEKINRGIYTLSEKGGKVFEMYPEQTEYFRESY